MADSKFLQQRAIARIDALSADLISISTTIHANPELAFKEFKAAALLSDTLEAHGFAVERGVGGLPTAFRATAHGLQQRPAVAILAEYDALAGMGHACGHNIIAASAIGAAIGVRDVIGELTGSVLAIGTPAEEGGGGKVLLLKAGVFAGVDAALMVHPASYTMVTRASLASFRLSIEFAGRASHAAAAPEDGISALQAVIQTFNNIDGLRLHLRGDARIHGIITNGGAAVNIIPERAAALFSVRAATQSYAEEVLKRVIACAEAAAVATGATLTYSATQGYAAITPNKSIARRYAAHLTSLGVAVEQPRGDERMGSTDFGDVTQALPGVHGYIAIAPRGTPGHSVELRAAAISADGHAGMLNAAKAMAMTAIELLNEPGLLEEARKEFAQSVAH